MGHQRRKGWGGLALTLLAGACGTEPSLPAAPAINGFTVTGNPGNVLSAIVAVDVDGADSVVVRYGPDSAGATHSGSTPAFAYHGAGTEVPVLGLLPSHPYRFEVTAYRGWLSTTSAARTLTTGPLPADLPTYEALGTDPTPGYVIFAAGVYLLAIDNTGRVVWYHRLAEGPSLNFMAQPNGRYVARPSTADPGDKESWIEIDVLGRATRRLDCAAGMVSRPHDLIALEDGSWWLLCDDARTMDLRALGGSAAARVTGTAVQHVAASGEVLFQWTPFTHFALEDAGPAALAGAAVNWTHGNALDLAPDGTLVVSFRNLSEVTGIDSRNGGVLWRLGGVRNQFAFEGTSAPAFASQHGVRLVGNDLMLLDNLGDPSGSRVERYSLDVPSRKARLVSAYRPSIPVIAQLGGTTQPLANGHLLASFGNGGRVEEYDASGRMVWQITGNPGYVFRAQRIGSLYSPGAANR